MTPPQVNTVLLLSTAFSFAVFLIELALVKCGYCEWGRMCGLQLNCIYRVGSRQTSARPEGCVCTLGFRSLSTLQSGESILPEKHNVCSCQARSTNQTCMLWLLLCLKERVTCLFGCSYFFLLLLH